MADEKLMNRWLVVLGGILVQLCLGAIYAWSVFTTPLVKAVADGGYGFTKPQTQLIFSAGLATFAVVMVIAGRMQAKTGPRPIAMAGGVVLGLGYILGGLFGNSFLMQFICIGLIGGAGIGLAYVVPIAVCVKWFPDMKGLITGFGVAGFGFGATLWVKLAGGFKSILWVVPYNFDGLLNTVQFGALPGVQSVFIIYGLIFLVCVLLGSIVMVNPPAGYKPAGWNPPAPVAGAAATGAIDLSERQMLATPQFYALWLTFMGSAMAGLMVIGCIALFGVDALQARSGMDESMAKATAGTAMALFAILNGMGRILWGAASDRIGRKVSIVLMCALQGAIMLVFFYIGGSALGLIVGACIIGFNFGGNFALFPAATADYFGNKNVGTNYGWVFLSYGVAGIVGPFIAGYFSGAVPQGAEFTVRLAAWFNPMVIASVACFASMGLALTLKAPKIK